MAEFNGEGYLVKYLIPAGDAVNALAELDAMGLSFLASIQGFQVMRCLLKFESWRTYKILTKHLRVIRNAWQFRFAQV